MSQFDGHVQTADAQELLDLAPLKDGMTRIPTTRPVTGHALMFEDMICVIHEEHRSLSGWAYDCTCSPFPTVIDD